MMETVATILAATAGVFVLLIIAVNVYFKIRPKFRIRVNCWFCHENTTVPYDERSCWDCPFCEQYNGFCTDGGYNKVIPAQHDEALNRPVRPRGPAKGEQKSVDGNGLCFRCNTNQQLKVHQLASFAPSHPSRHDEEVEDYRRKLERYYRLCDGCEKALEGTLARQEAWLLGLRLDRLRRSALLSKDALASGLGRHRKMAARCLWFVTVVLASCLLVSVAARLVDPTLAQLPLPPSVVGMMTGVLAWEAHLTVGGGAAQLLAGVCHRATQASLGSQWSVFNIVCVALWAVLHGLCWIMTLDEVHVWVSPRDMKVIHACIVLTTVIGCLVAAFQPRPTVGKSVLSKIVGKSIFSKNIGNSVVGKTASKKPTLVPTSPDGVDFSDGEEVEVEATLINSKGRRSQQAAAAKPHGGAFLPKAPTPPIKHEAVDLITSRPDPSAESFRTFRSTREDSCVRDPYKTRSRVPRTPRPPSNITDMLTGSVGNVSLPVGTPTPAGEDWEPDIGAGLRDLKLGSPLKSPLRSPEATCRPVVLTPSRLRPRSNVARSSWVAGGFWRAADSPREGTEDDVLPPLSQTSSQSSGFASRSSQMPNSRSSSVCGGDCDAQSTTSEGFCATPDGKRDYGPRPTLIYNAAGGFGFPGSVASDQSIDPAFKNCFYPYYAPPLFPPQPFYYPPQYLYGRPSPYGSRFCYPQQMPSPLWNAQAFGLPQRQLCITDTSRPASRCSEANDSSSPEARPTALGWFARYGVSLPNMLVVLALVCSLYYNVVYSGILTLTKPG